MQQNKQKKKKSQSEFYEIPPEAENAMGKCIRMKMNYEFE